MFFTMTPVGEQSQSEFYTESEQVIVKTHGYFHGKPFKALLEQKTKAEYGSVHVTIFKVAAFLNQKKFTNQQYTPNRSGARTRSRVPRRCWQRGHLWLLSRGHCHDP